MQWTEKTAAGRYIRLNNNAGGWKKKAALNVWRILCNRIAYANGVHGKYDDLKENWSIAVDKVVFQKKRKLK